MIPHWESLATKCWQKRERKGNKQEYKQLQIERRRQTKANNVRGKQQATKASSPKGIEEFFFIEEPLLINKIKII